MTSIYAPGLMPEIKVVAEVPVLEEKDFPLESLVSIEMIRTHTKTKDVPRVTNEQLELYRRAAFESAEHYTGFFLGKIRTISESVAFKGSTFRHKRTQRFTLKYPTVDGIVYLYGAHMNEGNQILQVDPGSTELQIPVLGSALDIRSCCDPCNSFGNVNYGMKVMYRTGYAKATDIPAGVILGVLKYIAWSIENVGDEVMTVKNKQTVSEGLLRGTNNAAWASGALELWRQYSEGG